VCHVFTCHVISLEQVIVRSCHVHEESFRGIRCVECGVNLCEFVLMLSTTLALIIQKGLCVTVFICHGMSIEHFMVRVRLVFQDSVCQGGF